MASKELTAFFRAVTELFGAEQTLAEDWLQPFLSKTICPRPHLNGGRSRQSFRVACRREAPAICASVPNIDTLSTIYSPDTDVTGITDYTAYTGNGRRVMTVPIVDALNPAGTMTVLGFRQFLVQPNQNQVDINPSDADGRFGALYIGSVVPVKQGRFDGCQAQAGPGKVVLHE